jgi:hypothetical protein
MGLKKLACILFILFISILHAVTLTTWLAKDADRIIHKETTGLNHSIDSLHTAKTSILINTPE